MIESNDDLDKLLLEVKKTINENRQFLERLVDETAVDDDGADDDALPAPVDEEFEEL